MIVRSGASDMVGYEVLRVFTLYGEEDKKLVDIIRSYKGKVF
jgi:hypothetical protein